MSSDLNLIEFSSDEENECFINYSVSVPIEPLSDVSSEEVPIEEPVRRVVLQPVIIRPQLPERLRRPPIGYFSYDVSNTDNKVINRNVVVYEEREVIGEEKWVEFDNYVTRPPFIRNYFLRNNSRNIDNVQRQLSESVFCNHLVIGDSNIVAWFDWLTSSKTPQVPQGEVKFKGAGISGTRLEELEFVFRRLQLDQFFCALLMVPIGSISYPEPNIDTLTNLRRFLSLLLTKVGHICLIGVPETAGYQKDGDKAEVEDRNGVKTGESLRSPYLRAVQLNKSIKELVVEEYKGKVRYHDLSRVLSDWEWDQYGNIHRFVRSDYFTHGQVYNYRGQPCVNRDHYSDQGFDKLTTVLEPMLKQCGHRGHNFNNPPPL